jgi:alanyl-tRNA synthetase
MTSTQIRQSFLDFFKSKQHTIVPSSSLMPDSPNLLFTNAGMNQFVPIFLGQTKCPYTPGRAADTQKCIRAGGKHNDLDDVGLDTYHHTFFEMLGNWSFGNYFKREAIDWAWELVVTIWKFPPQRLYATVYNPDKSKNDPSEFDQEAWNFWAEKFRSVGLDPAIHIVNGNKKDNFWMMGETGPCGPCSELHVDLTPAGDTKGSLVNKGDARCIEIWNLVFMQFNAQPKGGGGAPAADSASPATGASQPLIEFVPLTMQAVDTGMGFERVTSIIQGTKNLTDFAHAKISNYETDIFRPIFDAIEKLSGKKYGSTLPKSGSAGDTEQEKIDVAFRVIADHIRTLSFAIADGIQPGNTDRNYVLRRILRRAVRYGRTLGFKEPFFYKLVDVLADTMGDVFPEIRARKKTVQEVIRIEEESFNNTLDQGIGHFNHIIRFMESLERRGELCKQPDAISALCLLFKQEGAYVIPQYEGVGANAKQREFGEAFNKVVKTGNASLISKMLTLNSELKGTFSGDAAFLLYDTYGFPLDLTELMARERGLTVDKEGFEKLMEEQRARARAAQKKEVISLSQIETTTPTKFVGYDDLSVTAKVVEVVSLKDKTAVILDTSACYAEMGGQVGDTGELTGSGQLWRVINTQKSGNTFLHFVDGGGDAPVAGAQITLTVDKSRRDAIQRHHTVTHLLHWAIHEVASKEASQKGSFVGPDKLTFDFNSAALTPQQVADIEKLVNERILDNAGVSWTEVPHADVKNRKDVMQFFGDKYGDVVRVVQIGGDKNKLNGYSMELCGGTHTRATGEIGLFRIVSEAAVAAGVRRIEAVAGLTAYGLANEQLQLIKSIAGKINSPVGELEKKVEALLAHQKELEKALKSAHQKEAANAASALAALSQVINGTPAIINNLGHVDGEALQHIVDALKSQFKGVVVLGGAANGAVTLIASVSADFTAKVQAGKIIQTIAPIVGGKGGGKPDNARGGGKDASKLDEALAKAKSLL